MASRIGRREFIRGTTTTAVLASLVPGWLVVSSPQASHAVALRAVSDSEAAILLELVRELFPHPTLNDSFYAAVVADLDVAMADEVGIREQFRAGLGRMDELSGGSWLALPSPRRAAVIRKLEDQPFFKTLWWRASGSLYRNTAVWERFGYEGPSFSKGGYLSRGFDDIDWLPEDDAPATPEEPK